jgi:GNAT superfamily N-acetyltransferase
MLAIRQFEARDAQQASEILIAAFKSFLQEKFNDEHDAAYFHPEKLKSEAFVKDQFMVSQIFVAEDEGKIFGVVKVTASTNGLGCFDWVGVDPACHARGVGAMLMARAEHFWREHRQRKIHSCVSAHNKKALMYYLKHDFIPEGYCRDHFRIGVDEIILGRFLKE